MNIEQLKAKLHEREAYLTGCLEYCQDYEEEIALNAKKGEIIAILKHIGESNE